jgi:hypothetical protein
VFEVLSQFSKIKTRKTVIHEVSLVLETVREIQTHGFLQRSLVQEDFIGPTELTQMVVG